MSYFRRRNGIGLQIFEMQTTTRHSFTCRFAHHHLIRFTPVLIFPKEICKKNVLRWVQRPLNMGSSKHLAKLKSFLLFLLLHPNAQNSPFPQKKNGEERKRGITSPRFPNWTVSKMSKTEERQEKNLHF